MRVEQPAVAFLRDGREDTIGGSDDSSFRRAHQRYQGPRKDGSNVPIPENTNVTAGSLPAQLSTQHETDEVDVASKLRTESVGACRSGACETESKVPRAQWKTTSSDFKCPGAEPTSEVYKINQEISQQSSRSHIKANVPSHEQDLKPMDVAESPSNRAKANDTKIQAGHSQSWSKGPITSKIDDRDDAEIEGREGAAARSRRCLHTNPSAHWQPENKKEERTYKEAEETQDETLIEAAGQRRRRRIQTTSTRRIHLEPKATCDNSFENPLSTTKRQM